LRPADRRNGAARGSRGTAAPGLSHGERSLLGFFGAAWIVALLHLAGVVPLAGGLPLSLYGYYAFAAIAGWLAGNVYVLRRRRLAATVPVTACGRDRRLLAILYLFGPPALVYLLWALVPAAQQRLAPLAPLWAFGVYGVFFLVPIAFPPPARRPGG
jgi:hypothetical protein